MDNNANNTINNNPNTNMNTSNSNIGMTAKKFITSKNTVTIIGVILIILVLYFFYNWRIKSMTDPTPIPYALETLKPGTKITNAQVGTINVPKALLSKEVITDASQIVGKYVSEKSIIPQGSMFYQINIINSTSGNSKLTYPEDHVLVYLDVNTSTTYGNMIYPGDYMDIYLKIQYSDEAVKVEDSNKLTVGKLLSNVKVLKVVDSKGNDVFADLDDKGTPAQVIFALPSEYHILLRKAIYLRTYSATVIPVPVKVNKEEDLKVSVGSSELESFINRVTAWTGDGTTSGDLNIDNQQTTTDSTLIQ